MTMPIYTLNPQQTAWLPERQAVLTVTLPAGKAPGGMDLTQVSPDGSTRASHRLASNRWLVRAASEPCALRLQSQLTLPLGFSCEVSLAVAQDEVRLHTLDLSGLSQTTLFDVVGDGERMRVVALPDQVNEVALSPTAHAARRLAREVVDTPVRQGTVQVVVMVDVSSSMQPYLASGLVATIVESVVGAVAARAEEVRLTLVPAAHAILEMRDVEDLYEPLKLPATDERQVRSVFCAALADRWPDAPDRATYIVTDDVPHDIEILRSRSASHLVVIQPAGAGRPRCTEPCTVWRDDVDFPTSHLMRSLATTSASAPTEGGSP